LIWSSKTWDKKEKEIGVKNGQNIWSRDKGNHELKAYLSYSGSTIYIFLESLMKIKSFLHILKESPCDVSAYHSL